MENWVLKSLLDRVDRARMERILQEATRRHPHPEHERLREVLSNVAAASGYATPLDLASVTGNRFDPEPNPDVALQNAGRDIFVGDAKDSENERATHQGPRMRVFRYQQAFGQMLIAGTAPRGMFAIATNSQEAAQEWVASLNLGAGFCNVIHTAFGRPNYTWWQFDPQTWIVW